MGQVQHRDRVKIDELLSIREASDYFQVGPYTFYRLAKAGKVPAKLVDNAWRFKKEDLCTWIAGSPYDRRIRKERRQ
ncbi:MAG: helix-turn-helix domain-containing protein [Deltaproteobacteria bacterium]|nr:helix-turn-helix domain-containing protein [Deltaproteobacteria bacterium]